MSRSVSQTRRDEATIAIRLLRRVAKTVLRRVAMESDLRHGGKVIALGKEIVRHATEIVPRREGKTNGGRAAIVQCPAMAKDAAAALAVLVLRWVNQDSQADLGDPAILVGQEALQGRRWSLGPGCGIAIRRCSS